MKKITLKDVKPYNPPAHFGMVALKIQGLEETGLKKFWQGLSYFLPNGGAEMQYDVGMFGAQFEKTYFVISGELTVIDKADSRLTISTGDSVAIYPNEGRSIVNHTNQVTSVLVTVSTS